jgi:uncharacterized protein
VISIDFQTLPTFGTDLGQIEVGEGQAVIQAGPGTDAFVPPDGSAAIDRLVGLRFSLPQAPWCVRARVAPRFKSAFDAGALMLRADSGAWAKLAFERSPDGRPMAVSVVTRDVSDDANGPVFTGDALYLRALSTGAAYAFHVSTDGQRWELVRFFSLPGRVDVLEFIAQSPTGQGCLVTFSEAWYQEAIPADLRDGT